MDGGLTQRQWLQQRAKIGARQAAEGEFPLSHTLSVIRSRYLVHRYAMRCCSPEDRCS